MKSFIVSMANHPRKLFVGILASWLTGAFFFALTENQTALDSLYWSMTTMSTVGYGDLSPSSVAGKIFVIMFQAWSIFVIVPCAIAGILDAVRIDKGAFTHDEQEWMEDTLIKIAEANGIKAEATHSDY